MTAKAQSPLCYLIRDLLKTCWRPQTCMRASYCCDCRFLKSPPC